MHCLIVFLHIFEMNMPLWDMILYTPCASKVEYLLSLFIKLNLKIRFNFCTTLCFNVIWFVKRMKKIENRNNEYIAQLIDTTPCHVSPLSYASNPKIILLKLGAYSFAWCLLFIVTKRISN